MKKLCLFLLLFALLSTLLCACKQDVQEEESGAPVFQTYHLPTEWTVSSYRETRKYVLSYEGGTATVTEDGKLLLRVTLDENGNAVAREDADGPLLEAIYDADGRLAETLLRDRSGDVQQRTVYDRDGRAVREYTRGLYDLISLREITYGEGGEPAAEQRYSYCESHAYEYHANGALAAETTYLLDALPYERCEYDEAGSLTWKYRYDKHGNVSVRFKYDEEGKIAEEYDAEGNLYVNPLEEKIFDDDGNLTEYNYYDSDGSLVWREAYEYDGDGKQIAHRTYDGEGILSLEQVMTYDEAGVLQKTEEVSYDSSTGEFQYASVFEWDSFGNNTKATVCDEDGNVNTVAVREYQAIGNKWYMTLELTYDGAGVLQSRQESTYDGAGNTTSALFYDADGTLSSGTESTYDEAGNVIERITRYKFFPTTREVYVYDEQNHVTEYTSYNEDGSIDGHVLHENTYAYDDAGRPVRFTTAVLKQHLTYAYKDSNGLRTETCTDGDGNVVHTYETVYDGNGNPRILQRTEQGSEERYEYEWNPEGGLMTFVRSYADRKEAARLEAGNYAACSLTEPQYRQLLELLLTETGAIYKPSGYLVD